MSRGSKQALSPKLYYLSKYLQLCPVEIESSKQNIAAALLMISFQFYCSISENIYRFKTRSFILVDTVDVILHAMLVVLNFPIFIIAQSRSVHWKVLLGLVNRKIDGVVVNASNNYIFYLLHLMCAAVLIFVYCSIEGISFLPGNDVWYSSDFSLYVYLVIVLLINTFANSIKMNIVYAKKKLLLEIERLSSIKRSEKHGSTIFEMYQAKSELIETLARIIHVLKATKAFNKIYGIHILGQSALITMFLINNINTVSFLIEYNDVDVRIVMIESCFSLMFLIFKLLVIAPCFASTKELDQIRNVICDLLVELTLGVDDQRLEHMKHRLVLVDKLLEYSKPYFSAAGFFEVDYGVFVYIIGGVTSFVIVYLQLLNLI